MNCPDLKGYLLGEEPDAKSVETHLKACAACREEYAQLRATHAALLTVREEEIPRRIAFVSDKVFEPKWWQRIPRFAAAAAMLSAAIVFHALYVSSSMAALEKRVMERDEETRAAVTASFDYLNKKLAAERRLNAGYMQ